MSLYDVLTGCKYLSSSPSLALNLRSNSGLEDMPEVLVGDGCACRRGTGLTVENFSVCWSFKVDSVTDKRSSSLGIPDEVPRREPNNSQWFPAGKYDESLVFQSNFQCEFMWDSRSVGCFDIRSKVKAIQICYCKSVISVATKNGRLAIVPQNRKYTQEKLQCCDRPLVVSKTPSRLHRCTIGSLCSFFR